MLTLYEQKYKQELQKFAHSKLEEDEETITRMVHKNTNRVTASIIRRKFMAITSAICNSFKVEILKAVHNFTASGSGGNTFNLALYTSSATLNKSTTAYSSSNEISNTSGSAYSAKGKALTSVTPVLSSDTAVCDFANVSWTSAHSQLTVV